MNFESAKAYLLQLKAYERMKNYEYSEANFDLLKLRLFLAKFGVDYSRLKFVHVAGSKGKGTVCNYTANYLLGMGKRVGMFTSPFVVDERECFWLDGELITQESFAALVEELKCFVEMDNEFELTFFESLVVMALKYFVDAAVEYAVMEVGVGGGLDATNVISSQVAVVTRLEDEHLELLGGTRESLVEAKLGILKGDERLIVAKQDGEFDAILKRKLGNRPRVFFVDDGLVSRWGENGAVVFRVVEQIFGDVDELYLRDVLDGKNLVGRFDLRLIAGRKVVFDIAHTPKSISNLLMKLREKFPQLSFLFLISIMSDKDIGDILSQIDGFARKVILTNANDVRAFDPGKMASMLQYSEVVVDSDVGSAFDCALKEVNKNEILVVTGSHFLISLILRQI